MIKDILTKYENFYKGGSGYTFQVEVDDFNTLVQHISSTKRSMKMDKLNEWQKKWDRAGSNPESERIFNEMIKYIGELEEANAELAKEIVEHCETKGLAGRQVFALTKRVDELVEERKRFKEFLQQTSDIDKRADALIKEQAEKIEQLESIISIGLKRVRQLEKERD